MRPPGFQTEPGKGIDVLDYYCAYDPNVTGFGLLPPDLTTLPRDAKWDAVATPPMRAVRNLARAFAGATPLDATRPLQVDVTALGPPRKVFEGNASHPPLWQRDAFAVLPFQATAHKFVIALYAMTYDATQPFPAQRYRLTLRGFATTPDKIELYDPIRDHAVDFQVLSKSPDPLTIEFAATDTPRLLTIETR